MSKENNKISTTSTNLLSEGKSTRLMEMRNHSLNQLRQKATQQIEVSNKLEDSVKADLFDARKIIDQRLTNILSDFPSNKCGKFFAIRYGLSVEQLKELSIKEIFSILSLNNKQTSNMKRIEYLDYNGRSTL